MRRCPVCGNMAQYCICENSVGELVDAALTEAIEEDPDLQAQTDPHHHHHDGVARRGQPFAMMQVYMPCECGASDCHSFVPSVILPVAITVEPGGAFTYHLPGGAP